MLNTTLCKIVQFADDGILYDLKADPYDILRFPPESGVMVNWTKSGWISRSGRWFTSLRFLGLQYEHRTLKTSPIKASSERQEGTMENSTRTRKPYILDSYRAIEEADKYDRTKTVSPTDSPNESFESWFKTKYQNFVVSRLYHGILSIETLKQDFTYHYIRRSWTDLENRRKKNKGPYYRVDPQGRPIALNVFNSSSFAHNSISSRILMTLKPG